MEVIYSKEHMTYNFTHNNGMQTSVKLNPSGSFTPDNLDRDKPKLVDKQKYTVIISSSLGCQQRCTFCHLTQQNKPFEEKDGSVIYDNVIDALTYIGEPLSTKYIKLCFMGEGEPILNMERTSSVAKVILKNVLRLGLAKGVDGVDIATMMPNISPSKLQQVVTLDKELSMAGYKLNPFNHSDKGRSVVRLFYSLHHYDQTKRDIIIPMSKSIDKTMHLLETSVLNKGVNVVTHYMFMEGVNDSHDDVEGLISFINNKTLFQSSEFRILRYNGYNDTESGNMSGIITKLTSDLNVRKLKVQFSAGEDISAACGMFLK